MVGYTHLWRFDGCTNNDFLCRSDRKKAVAFGAMNATGPGVKSGDVIEQKQQNHVLQGIAVDASYDVTRFSLPTGARNLIVVEGFARNSKTAQSGAKPENLYNKVRVIAYHRDSDNAPWVARVKSLGVMGWGGMSNHRFEGSGITPIGLFKMGTAFGRKEAMEGFSKNYVKIDPQAKSQYWSKRTNRLENNANTLLQDGEKLWASGFAGIYDYVIDSGFNVNNANGDGSALFLHCTYPGKATTGGCVAIDPQAMIAIEKMYATGIVTLLRLHLGSLKVSILLTMKQEKCHRELFQRQANSSMMCRQKFNGKRGIKYS